MSFPRRIAATGGRSPSGYVSQLPADPNRKELERLQRQNNGLDVESFVRATGVEEYQEPLPGLDLIWLSESEEQATFALTGRSFRGGLNMQRGYIEEAHLRQALSEGLISHARDELILAFDIEKQSNLQTPFNNYNLLHTNYLDQEVMIPYLGSQFYCETSAVDPTVIQMLNGVYPTVTGVSVIRAGGIDYLAICTLAGTVFRNGIDPHLGDTGLLIFKTEVAAPNPTGGIAMIGHAGGGGGSGPTTHKIVGILWGGGQVTSVTGPESFTALNIVQSPAPGNPLIVRTSTHILQVPVQDEDGNTSFTEPCFVMHRNVGLGNSQPLGWLVVSGRETRQYYWETNTGGPASNGTFRSRITSVDASGYRYRVHDMSSSRILGCCPVRQRGALAWEDGYHVVLWDGRERDLGLFADEPPNPGFTLFCVGLHELEGQIVASIAELPSADSSLGLGAGVGQGRIRTCFRKYDFAIRQWFQISEWETLTNSGLIRWNNGVPVPVGNTAIDPDYGFMPTYGAPDLPWGKVSRYLHNHMMPARYTYDLNAALSPPPAGSFLSTWYRKFEPPAGVNPFSFRGSKPFASYGRTRSPGLIWPGRSRWANKYIDAIEWLGQDTGGPGSLTRISVGEYGHLDDVNSAGDRPLISREFPYGLPHDRRRMVINNNQTPFMIPQIEVEVERDDSELDSDSKLTPQGLPFTLYGHVDFMPLITRPPVEPVGRSKA